MKRPEIRRCPHCDSYFATSSIHRVMTRHWWQKKYEVHCNYCHHYSPRAITIRGAIKNWNNDEERMRHWREYKMWGR